MKNTAKDTEGKSFQDSRDELNVAAGSTWIQLKVPFSVEATCSDLRELVCVCVLVRSLPDGNVSQMLDLLCVSGLELHVSGGDCTVWFVGSVFLLFWWSPWLLSVCSNHKFKSINTEDKKDKKDIVFTVFFMCHILHIKISYLF